MFENINIALILVAGFIAMASPGPATMAIAGTSMAHGQRQGLALAAGVTTGSILWSMAAAFGLSSIMISNAWVFQILKYIGAAYLIYLAFKAAVSAINPKSEIKTDSSDKGAYSKGLALHLTNPKAILFFGSLYAVGIPAETTAANLIAVVLSLGFLAFVIFHSYAVLFSNPLLVASYMKLHRVFESVFALMFGIAGVKILSTRLG